MSKRRARARKQKRHKKRRKVSTPLKAIPKSALDTTADIVHHIVCEATETDGEAMCVYYATIGCLALAELGFPACVMGGGIAWLVDPPDGYVSMVPQATNPGVEFHTWCATTGNTSSDDSLLYIDFSTRTLRAWYDRRAAMFVDVPWTRKDALPNYVCGKKSAFSNSFSRLYGDFVYVPNGAVVRCWQSEINRVANHYREPVKAIMAAQADLIAITAI